MHVDEFIFNCCVSSMVSDDISDPPEECAMNVFSIDENKIRDANGIIFAEAITCYKCTFCGKMFAAMEVVLTHYQSNHRCSVIPLLKGIPKSTPILKVQKSKPSESVRRGRPTKTPTPLQTKAQFSANQKNETRNTRSNNTISESPAPKKLKLLRESTENKQKTVKLVKNTAQKKNFKCQYLGCGKTFSYHNSLLSHRKTHIKFKSYKCDWNDCQFTCSDSAGLDFHKRTHSGDNPFKCSWPGCDQSFADASAKDQHLQKEHIGDRTLQCDYPGCAAKFKLSAERERHRAIHLGKKISAPVEVKRKKVITISDSDSDSDEVDDEEDEDEEIEEENKEDIENKSEKSISKEAEVKNEEPLDLSKNSDSIKDEKKESTKATKEKSNKEITKEKISKTMYRCDYPGCRKTYTLKDTLKEHEKEAHKTIETEGRSRYDRKCKGNLYYKI